MNIKRFRAAPPYCAREARRVPLADVLVEGGGAIEHAEQRVAANVEMITKLVSNASHIVVETRRFQQLVQPCREHHVAGVQGTNVQALSTRVLIALNLHHPAVVVTLSVSHSPMVWLKARAPRNILNGE